MERQLTVVQTLPSLESGGVERGTLEVSKFLVKRGHRSLVISSGGRLVETLIKEGGEHIQWDIGRKSLSTIKLIPKLRKYLNDNDVDILHARSRLPAWISYLAWKGMDPTLRPNFVTTVHGRYSVHPYSAIMTKGERVIVISESIKEYVLRCYPSVDANRVRLIYRGVDPEYYPYGYHPTDHWLSTWYADFPETWGKRLITLPARLTRWKGQLDFIDLLYRIKGAAPDIHGLIVGETKGGKEGFLSELKYLAESLGISDKLTFTGHRRDLREILSISSIVYSLSRDPEGFGRTTLEALYLGIPVIAYNHGGVGEQLSAILPDGAITVGDIDSLTKKTIHWLAHPLQVNPTNNFSLDSMLHRTVGVYEEFYNKPYI